MIDLYFFDSAKMAIVFILMLLSSATMKAQRHDKDKFYDLVTAIGEYFGGEFNEAEKVLELDLNGANSYLEELHTFATHKIVTKNENGEFECKELKNPGFKRAIRAILGEKSDKDVRNLLEAIIVPKPIKTILDENSFKKLEDLIKEISVKFSEEKLFNLLFSFAARLEALVHGKNIDGTLKEKQENSKEKIQTFLAVSKCFILPESELSIYDYWIKINKMKSNNRRKPIFVVALYKEKYDTYKNENRAFKLSKENYKILKHLNDQKFSIYGSLNLLRATFNLAYETFNYEDEETNRRYAAQLSKQKHILRGKIPLIFVNLLNQINSVFYFIWKRNEYWDKNKKCEFAMFFQNISENLMKMMSDKGIDPKLHLESIDFKIQEYVQNDVEENCKKFDNEEAKIIFLNNVHYELAINFEFNQRKDIYERVEDLLSDWVGDDSLINMYGIWPLSEESYLKKNATKMLRKIEHFIKNTNRESISIIDALIEKEFNLVTLFDQMKTLVDETIPEEEANLEKAINEINTKQLENDIEFLKKKPKSIAEEKYQKAVAIISTIKQFDKKVKKLKSKIKNIEIKKKLIKLLSRVRKNEMQYFGPELWKQTKDSCNHLKPKQIEMEEKEIVSEEILLVDIQFEFDEIWNSYLGVWSGIEIYYLQISLRQITEEVRTLAKTFEKMLQNVTEHCGKKKEASNVV